MCCRFYEEREVIEYINRSFGEFVPGPTVAKGDVRPSDPAVLLRKKRDAIRADVMRWGFLSYDKGKLLINARSETAFDKISFADSIRERRCIIPAEHFYEWDRSKSIVTFTVPDRKIIFLAGIYKRFDGEDRFTVLTTKANDSMQPVHDRMPLILPEDAVKDWILDDSAVRDLLHEKQPELHRQQEYEQLSLF